MTCEATARSSVAWRAASSLSRAAAAKSASKPMAQRGREPRRAGNNDHCSIEEGVEMLCGLSIDAGPRSNMHAGAQAHGWRPPHRTGHTLTHRNCKVHSGQRGQIQSTPRKMAPPRAARRNAAQVHPGGSGPGNQAHGAQGQEVASLTTRGWTPQEAGGSSTSQTTPGLGSCSGCRALPSSSA